MHRNAYLIFGLAAWAITLAKIYVYLFPPAFLESLHLNGYLIILLILPALWLCLVSLMLILGKRPWRHYWWVWLSFPFIFAELMYFWGLFWGPRGQI